MPVNPAPERGWGKAKRLCVSEPVQREASLARNPSEYLWPSEVLDPGPKPP